MKRSLDQLKDRDRTSMISKILILRTAPWETFHYAAQSLYMAFPETTIQALAQEEVADQIEKLYFRVDGQPCIKQVISYGCGFFDPKKHLKPTLEKIIAENYDLAVLLYNNPYKNGYWAWHRFLWLSKIPRIAVWKPALNSDFVSRSRLAWGPIYWMSREEFAQEVFLYQPLAKIIGSIIIFLYLNLCHLGRLFLNRLGRN